MNNVVFFTDLSVLAQVIIHGRLVNWHIDEGAELGEALDNADETMCNKISLLYGDTMTADTVFCSDLIAEDEHGRYIDTTSLDNIYTADRARDIAILWSYERSLYNTSYDELFEISFYFEELASRYPELEQEFKENGIL